jgi:hypothetical protein
MRREQLTLDEALRPLSVEDEVEDIHFADEFEDQELLTEPEEEIEQFEEVVDSEEPEN